MILAIKKIQMLVKIIRPVKEMRKMSQKERKMVPSKIMVKAGTKGYNGSLKLVPKL